jgi:alpha-D-ribose 1-methylphosphonate 5-triphosphate synthase subunit PhnL
MSLLTVTNLSKTFHVYQLDRQIPAFSGLSFQLEPGQCILVRGPNGVGKSTLLRCLYRTYLPSSGQAIYQSQHGPIDLASAADVDIAHLRRSEIGHVTQFLRPRPRVSALDLAAEPLVHSAADWPAARQQAGEWLAAFGLKPDIWQAYPTTFSGGEQQKVNLVRALIRPQRLLLLDEPTASLDVATRTALLDRMRQLKRRQVAMIGVFHHTEDVAALVDQEIWLTNEQLEEPADQ